MADPVSPLRPPLAPPPAAPPAPPIGDPPSVQERVNALNERNAALVLELAAAKAASAEVVALRQRATLAERRADAAAYPALRHPDVSAHVSGQYDAYASRTGEAAKPFAEWLTGEGATNPLVSPYLVVPAPPPAAGAPPPIPGQPPPVNPSATALPGGSAPPLTAFSKESVRNMSPADVRANLAPIIDQGMKEGEFYISPELKQRLGLAPKPPA